ASKNGILMLLAVEDRQVRIEVGYGLEEFITDGFAGQTSRETMVPFFKQGDYGGGMRAGAERIALRLAEARAVALPGVAMSKPPGSRQHAINPFNVFWLIVV